MIRFGWFSRLTSFVIAATVGLVGAGPMWAQGDAPETDYLLSPLPERAWCAGQVVDERQQPVRGARLLLVPQLHRMIEDHAPPSESTAVTHAAQTDGQGRFEFDLPIDRDPEFWRSADLALIVQADGYETVVRDIKAARLLANAPFQLNMKAGKSTRLLVRHADGAPVPRAKVRLSRIGMLSVFESANGLPEFQSGSQGEVELPGWSAGNLQEIAVQLADGAEVRVEVKPSDGELVATLPPLARVSGRVAIEEQGQAKPIDPLVGKRLWILSESADRGSVGVPKSWTPAMVQQDGSFHAGGAIAGRLLPRFPPSPQVPYLPAGDTGYKSYTLRPWK
ncbi:MAG: hypothetical protein KatS3mg111_3990 [Pirellulaceae bacterium]|nr:MAG: hypothetical protein KatS3mg111_3990 [Pirellulaceae bacterium]